MTTGGFWVMFKKIQDLDFGLLSSENLNQVKIKAKSNQKRNQIKSEKKEKKKSEKNTSKDSSSEKSDSDR